MRRPRGNQHPFAGQRPRPRGTQHALGDGGDFRRLRHAACSGFAGFGHFAGVGSDQRDAVARQLRDVAPGSGIVPHQGVHRRRQQDRSVGRQQDGAGEIVGMAACHLRHQVRGRRRHHDQVAVARQPDMAGVELAFGIEQVGVGALVRQRGGRKRRNELLRGPGQHTADADLPLFQPPDQVERLVGGDAAADDQGDADLVRIERLSLKAGWRGGGRRGGLRRRRGELEWHALHHLAQDDPDFLFDGASVAGRADPQIDFYFLIELSDGQAGHGRSGRNVIAMLSHHACNAITIAGPQTGCR